jgi:hypothetical protein
MNEGGKMDKIDEIKEFFKAIQKDKEFSISVYSACNEIIIGILKLQIALSVDKMKEIENNG